MRTSLCDLLGIEYPIVAFSHCRDVVAAVSRCGGLGVLGAATFSPDELDRELTALEKQCPGRPYGVDLVFPVKYRGDDEVELRRMIPPEHIEFVHQLEDRFGIPPRTSTDESSTVRGHVRAREQWDVARGHDVALLASALGPAPLDVQDSAHAAGILTAGLVGAVRHTKAHVAAGTDVIIAQGTEAGGHSGDISTLVLVPQIVDAVGPRPVLAAGGIGDGRQIAAALALGAVGVWTGSVWLTTAESDTHPVLKEKLLGASSQDTLRSKCRTGKTVRQLRTPWVEAWEAPTAPTPLPAPLQQMLVRDATLSAVEHGVADALGTPIGQVVGMMNDRRPVRPVIDRLIAEYVEAVGRVAATMADA
jgi:NAD(P)H-dependent flavin oxidoreductase YrpB (nitropropane dioxygenase family)